MRANTENTGMRVHNLIPCSNRTVPSFGVVEFKPCGSQVKDVAPPAVDKDVPWVRKLDRELTRRDWLDNPKDLTAFEFLASFDLYAYGYIP